MSQPTVVLYVEDEADIRNSMEEYFSRRFDSVITSTNGAEALEAFVQHKPDLVITDLRMPNVNGVELIRSIRKVDEDIPILVMSAYGDQDFLTDSIKHTIQGTITKPVDYDALENLLEFFGKKRRVDEIIKEEDLLKMQVRKTKATNASVSETPPNNRLVAGIGSSAGGLEALTGFFEGLPAKNRTTYIIAQHLSPTHKTLLVDILSRCTDIPILTAEHGASLNEDVIYITPQNRNIAIDSDGKIALSVPDEASILPKPSVNLLLSSIAEQFTSEAIGIILSGTGSDGAQGMRTISAKGGITIVQEPGSAKYDGMPRASLSGAPIDMVLHPRDMGSELVSLAHFPRSTVLNRHSSSAAVDEYTSLFQHLYQTKKVDFSSYKRSTVSRRIERRMAARKIHSLNDYVQLVTTEANETQALFNDILIGVTKFFRDTDSFRALKVAVEKYLDQKPDLKEYRVWMPGASTGEEAYSVAITLQDILEKKARNLSLRIFATDIDERAIKVARKGHYSSMIAEDVPKEILDSYFTTVGSESQVKKTVRDSIVFSEHNLLSDPPFKDLDLVVCRNLLIYFTSETNRRLIPNFNYALKNDGILFLGQSENISSSEALFDEINGKEKIFSNKSANKKNRRAKLPAKNIKDHAEKPSNQDIVVPVKKESLADEIAYAAGKIVLPNLLVLNTHYEIVYKKGDFDFIKMQDGYVSYNFFKMIEPAMAIDVRTAIDSAQKKMTAVETPYLQINDGRLIKTYVVPIERTTEKLYALYFQTIHTQDLPPVSIAGGEAYAADAQLRYELERTKEHLNSLVEELETSNEELQSTNEELQSSNEELQSTNEELETGNEELQSTNEELHSAYAELNHLFKTNNAITSELETTKLRYEQVLDSLNDAVFISRLDSIILRSNRAMQSLSGYSKDALAAKHLNELLNTDCSIPENRKVELINHGHFGPYQFNMKNAKTNETVYLQVREYLIRDTSPPNHQMIWSFATDITQEVFNKAEIKKSEQRYKNIFERSKVGLATVSPSGLISTANHSLCVFLGYTEQKLTELNLQRIIAPMHTETASSLLIREDQPAEEKSDFAEIQFFHASGKIVWGRFSVNNNDDGDGDCIVSIEDINDIKQQIHQLEQNHIVLNATQEAIIVTDSKFNLVSVNESFKSITGYTADEVIGKNVRLLKSGKHPQYFYEDLGRSVRQTGLWSGEIINKTKDGRYYPAFLNITTIRNQNDDVHQYVGVLSDITVLKESQYKIDFLANHDTLTRLPNRTLLKDRLEHSLEKARRSNTHLAVLFIDLDRFKVVNDGLGHQIGDDVLKEIAIRLKSCLREEDTVARFGGDEFVVILDELNKPTDASKVAQLIISALSKPINTDGHEITIGASIGISVYPSDGSTSDELIRLADIAMYEAKSAGRDTFRFTTQDMSSDAFEKVTLENAIREGLKHEHFELHYQPIVCLKTGAIKHAEALIRWNSPALGMIMPSKFIPIAEESGLITSIADYVAHRAIGMIKDISQQTNEQIKVSVNLSAKDFSSSELFHRMKSYLHKYQVGGESLILELTERVLANSDSKQNQYVGLYAGLGMEIAVDDFGTGYSNLITLSKLDIDYLKIDKSFIDGIGKDTSAEELVKATIAIAKALGLKTIAEGIETKEQHAFLAEHNCDQGQGYYMFMPMASDKFMKLLKEH